MHIYIYTLTHTSPLHLCRSCHRRLFFPEKNTHLDFWNMYSCMLWILWFFSDFRVRRYLFKLWSICSNDYASKMRIEIMCKKMCCIAPQFFSQPDFLGNSSDDRTLARMSAWKFSWGSVVQASQAGGIQVRSGRGTSWQTLGERPGADGSRCTWSCWVRTL